MIFCLFPLVVDFTQAVQLKGFQPHPVLRHLVGEVKTVVLVADLDQTIGARLAIGAAPLTGSARPRGCRLVPWLAMEAIHQVH